MKSLLILLINFYQKLPLNSHFYCKFTPTCSEYTKQAIQEFGSFRGSFIGLKRILRCNPFNKNYGADPLIKRSRKK